MEQQVFETIAKDHMLQQGDTVAVGVSGGADSVALLHFLYQHRHVWNLTLLVCHLNHSLRGEESLRDQEFVRRLAADWGLEFGLEVADAAGEARLRGRSVEEAARSLRYDFFARCAGPTGKIATAHTLSDSMETLLLNLTRGTGVRGLRGIPAVRGQIIRPLAGVTRAQVEDYCRCHGLEMVHDSTNDSLTYTRNRLRHQVLPVLTQLNPALTATLSRLMEQMGEQWAMTQDLAREASQRLRWGDTLDRPGLLALHRPVRMALLQELLGEAGGEESTRLLTLMEEVLLQGTGAVELTTGVYFTSGTDLCGLRRAAPTLAPVSCPIPESLLHQGGLTPPVGRKQLKFAIFHNLDRQKSEKINKALFQNALDCARIESNVVLRTKADGDRISLRGGAGTRLLKKYYQEAGIPPEERTRLLVLTDGAGILWAEGVGVHRRAAPTRDTTAALIIDVLEEQEDGSK